MGKSTVGVKPHTGRARRGLEPDREKAPCGHGDARTPPPGGHRSVYLVHVESVSNPSISVGGRALSHHCEALTEGGGGRGTADRDTHRERC